MLSRIDYDIEPWRQLILQGAITIDVGGLCKNALKNGVAHCIAGAMMEHERKYPVNVYFDASTALHAEAKRRGYADFVDFNNAPLTTARDASSFMRHVALERVSV